MEGFLIFIFFGIFHIITTCIKHNFIKLLQTVCWGRSIEMKSNPMSTFMVVFTFVPYIPSQDSFFRSLHFLDPLPMSHYTLFPILILCLFILCILSLCPYAPMSLSHILYVLIPSLFVFSISVPSKIHPISLSK